MSLKKLTDKFNGVKKNSSDIFIVLIVILVALIAFGIGRLTAPKSEPILIKNLEQASVEDLKIEQSTSAPTDVGTTADKGKVVGSKNSDKYHLPECPGAKQISEQNKIWFDSIEAAEKEGYKPAGNCPGLNK
ncbi:MAG: Ada metal-binding domain-containing protein [Candidatus Omnitrophota bacterium]|nr:Ada metal-binding domain-containing protein [Candidatus Omnitrophota bacterium]